MAHSAETKAKISAAMKGNKSSLGRPCSEETRAKQRASHIGLHVGPKHPLWRKSHSLETRARISASRKGRKFGPRSEATKKKIGLAVSGSSNGQWRGGKTINNGYVSLYAPSHPFADARGYVFEHRLVMETHIGRPLLPTEIVHHINGIKDDNRIENLSLFSSNREHMKNHKRKKP